MQNPANLERVAGIEPASSAWKAEVLPLNYTRELAALAKTGGGRRIRTFEALATDLQSVPFDRSGIPPDVAGILFVCRPSVKRFFKFFQSNLKLSCFDTASSSTT